MHSLKNVRTFYDPSTKIWSGLAKDSVLNPYQNVADHVFEILRKNGDKVIQISADSGEQLTGTELRLRSVRIAQNLLQMGFANKQAIFTMAARNGEHTAPAVFACLALGIPLNTLEPTFERGDLSHMLETVQPTLVFCDNDTLNEMIAACRTSKIDPKIILLGDYLGGFENIEKLLQPTGSEETFTPIKLQNPANHPAIIMCSSGTMDRSEAVCLSHSICIAQVATFFDCLPTDRTLSFTSLYWLSGLMELLVGTLSGATRIITPEPFNVKLAVDIVERFRVSVLCLDPAHAQVIVKCRKVSPSSLESIRLGICAGSKVSAVLKMSFEKLIPGRSLEIAYGFPEIGTAVTLTDGDIYREGSVGFVRPGIQLKIVDDDGRAVDVGQEGEILVQAKFFFSGFYGNEPAIGDVLDSEGWLHSGDIGLFDEDGFLYVIKRKKDIIKCHNFQISPSEIESVIQEVPGVAGVCVVGVPMTPTEWPAALVVRTDEASGRPEAVKIIQKVEDTLPGYKHLRGGVFFTDQLPTTASGKILRKSVKDIVMKMRSEETKSM